MNGSEDLVIPTGADVVGVTLTVAKVGSGLSKVFLSVESLQSVEPI